MASERQIEANRRNARQSTGPRTASGKARSRQNAFRHGLSRAAISEDTETEKLVQTILGNVTHELLVFELADLVRAKLELGRIRAVRHGLLAGVLQCPDAKWAKRLRGLERYERAALAKQKRILRAGKVSRRTESDTDKTKPIGN
jgi:hypothetical protein